MIYALNEYDPYQAPHKLYRFDLHEEVCTLQDDGEQENELKDRQRRKLIKKKSVLPLMEGHVLN
jgi:hypothetical protein